MMIDQLNDSADIWWSIMMQAAWQSTAVALAILVAVVWLRRMPATIRYMLVLVALAKFLTPPLLTLPMGLFGLLATSQTPVPITVTTPDLSPPTTSLVTVAAEEFSPPLPLIADAVKQSEVEQPAVYPASPVIDQENMHSKAASSRVNSPEQPVAAVGPVLQWRSWLMLAHGMGIVGTAAWIFSNAIQLLRCTREAKEVTDGPLYDEFQTIAKHMQIRRPVRLLMSSRPITPSASGVWRPAVIVPAAMMQQATPADQRAILAHELAHHRRHDLWVLWLQGLLLMLWWFHPIAWLLNRTILRLREQCCDDLVVLEGFSCREGYCGALVRAVEWCSVRTRIVGSLASHIHPLENRIARVMDDRVRRSASLSWTGKSFLVVLVLMLLPGARSQSPVVAAVDDGPAEAKEPSALLARVVKGLVLDQDNNPVKAAVWMRTDHQGVHLASTKTDAKGRFRFADVKQEKVTLVAVAEGQSFAGLHYDPSRPLGEDAKLVVTPGKTLRVKLANKNGEPVEGAELSQINWQLPDGSSFRLPLEIFDCQGLPRPKSDANGLLSIPSVPSKAECAVIVKHPDFARASADDLNVNKRPRTIVMERGSEIIISAVIAETGEPALDATVSISGSPRSIEFTDEPVDEKGQLTIRLPVTPDEAMIKVKHPSLLANRWIELRRGTGNWEVEMKLYRKAKARGRVVDANTGKPQAGVAVNMVNRRFGEVIGQIVTDKQGGYEIEGPAGEVTFEVRDTKHFYGNTGQDAHELDQRIEVSLVPGETTSVGELLCMPSPRIRGTVFMPDGQPLDRAIVSCLKGPNVRYVRTDEHGQFEISLISTDARDAEKASAGGIFGLSGQLIAEALFLRDWQGLGPTFFLYASHPTERFISGVVVPSEDAVASKEVVIHLRAESEVQGTLVGDNGEPMANYPVQVIALPATQPRQDQQWLARRASLGQTNAVSDERGRFRLGGLYPNTRYAINVGQRTSGDTYSDTVNVAQLKNGGAVVSRELILNGRSPRFSFLATRPQIQLKPITVPAAMVTDSDETKPSQVAPELQCDSWINSEPISLESLRGKVVLLDFSLHWARFGIAKLPSVQFAHELFEDKGLVVIGLGSHSSPEKYVKELIRRHNLTYPIGLDTDLGTVGIRYYLGMTAKRYDVKHGISHILIDRSGKISARIRLEENLIHSVRRAVLYGNK